jgi:hypothetical protein
MTLRGEYRAEYEAVDVTIANGQSESTVAVCGGLKLAGILFPAALDGVEIRFNGKLRSTDASRVRLKDGQGVDKEAVVTLGTLCYFGTEYLPPVYDLTIQTTTNAGAATTQTAGPRTVTLLFEKER